MEIINKITFDMAAAGMPPYIDAVQGDTLTRKVEITLMKRGQVFDPSDGFVSVSVAFKKPDGTAGWYDTLPDGNIAATVISDGVYQVSLAPEMFTVPGSVYALFRFDLDGKTISTFPFVVRVAENPSFNSTKSENYYNVQTWDSVNVSFDEIFDRLAKLEQGGGGGSALWNSYGLPQLLLYGDISAMTKDDAVTLDYVYGDKSGTCTAKWQGTSSLAFPKKNYTIKFDNAFEAHEGWGSHEKYCLKANWVDFSHARNVVSAKLWGQVVKTRRGTNNNIFSPNYIGFVDGVQSVNGLTVTANEDGSLTVMGTATAWTHITVQHELYAGNTNILTNGLNTDNYNDEYVISVTNSKGEYPSGLEWFGYDANSHMAFIRVNEGDSINDTIYPKIEKGRVATPWEPQLSADTKKLSTLVNGGGVDGFPIVVSINGAYQGIYTFNIPKDGWMFDMGNGVQEGIVCAEGGTYLREQVSCDGTETDFSIEYATDEDNTSWIPTSVNRLIDSLNNSDGTDVNTTIAQYLDWDSAIDYFAMSLLFNNFDGFGKNYLLATYDGTRWLFSAYDMDSTHGLWWNGQEIMSAINHVSGKVSSFRQNKVFDMICLYKKEELKARYTDLRNSVLSDDNVITAFANFICKIPKGLYDMETELWVDIPSTSVNNLAQIADFYKRRSAFIDREIENL